MWSANVCYGSLLALALGLACSVDSEVDRSSTLSLLKIMSTKSGCSDSGASI